MTVKELIAILEKVEDKDLDVIYFDDSTGTLVEEVHKDNRYYGKTEENGCWVSATRECIAIF